ncbi:MAG TPA: hypothetical protein VFV63_02620, partial [Ilumatobacteraceae bacterium]|nr:hypothetical protein [Ilumatobacteraceae bacterium]
MTNVHPDRVVDDALQESLPDEARTRRTWLRNVALGAAGATAGAMVFGKDASAADDDPLTLGNSAGAVTTNTSSTPTTLVYGGPEITEGPSVLGVSDAIPAADAPFPANVGGYGNDLVANGLHGSTTNPLGYGAVVANLAPDAATGTEPAPNGLAVASMHGSQIQFVGLPGAVSGPTTGTHVPGELYADLDGTLWFAVPATPGGTGVRWVKLAGTATAGAFHSITPSRAYDSRKTAYTLNGPLAPNTSRVVSLADSHTTEGAVITTNVVPVGATAAHINLTVSSPSNKNFLAVAAGDAVSTPTSLMNWDLGVTQIANSITVPLDGTRQIKVFCGDQAG